MRVSTGPTVVARVTVTAGEDLPGVPGFVFSEFNPLVNEVARRCMAAEGVGDISGGRTALLLGTRYGDATTSDLASRNLARGQVRNPLLFYQSVPTTILGNVAREYAITGPMICLSTAGDIEAELHATADSLLSGGDADTAVLIQVELAANPRTSRLANDRRTSVATAAVIRKEN